MKLNFVDFLLNKRSESFQTRMLVALNIFAFLITLSTIIAHAFIDADVRLAYYMCLVIAPISAVSCELALHKKTQRFVYKMSVFLFPFVYLPASFIVAGSITLPVGVYLFFIILLLNFIASKKELRIINTFIFLFVTVFTYIEFAHPYYLLEIPRSEFLFKWWITALPPMVLMSIYLSTMIMESFSRERNIMLEQQRQLEKKNDELETQTRVDNLTGLFNKRYLNEQLQSYINLSQRQHFPLSLIVADIDFFKNYNDFYGHIQGDKCLREVADIIRECVGRTSDYIFRFGGEEFVVLLPFTDVAGSIEVAERIINTINQQGIEHKASKIDDHITLSLGITTYNNEPNICSDELIRQADKALYRMKQSGRNGYSISH